MTKHWFGATAQNHSMASLASHPGRISEMISQEFIVSLDWLDKGVMCVNGQRELDAWSVGTKGIVCALLFDSIKGWQVKVEHSDDQVDMDQYWVEIPLEDFLRCTRPLVMTDVPDYQQEAANDR